MYYVFNNNFFWSFPVFCVYRKVTYIKREQADTILTEGGSRGVISIAVSPIQKFGRSLHTIITIVFQATRRAKIRLQLFIISSKHHSPLNPEDRTTKQGLLQLHNHYHRELPLKEFFYYPSWLLIYGFSIWTERKILDLIVHWNRSRAFVLFYQSSTIYSFFTRIHDESAKMVVWKRSKPSSTVLWNNKSSCFFVTLLLLVPIIQTVLLYIESMFIV